MIIEDDAATASRLEGIGTGNGRRGSIVVQLHEVANGQVRLVGRLSYRAGSLRSRIGKAAIALQLLDDADVGGAMVVAGPTYGSNDSFVRELLARRIPFVVEVRASDVARKYGVRLSDRGTITREFAELQWKEVVVRGGALPEGMRFRVARVSALAGKSEMSVSVIVAQSGRIVGAHRGSIFALTSEKRYGAAGLVGAVMWTRWIRTLARRSARADQNPSVPMSVPVRVRANISLAARQDERHLAKQYEEPALRGVLGGGGRRLNLVELFAGAGGMGLGFLLAGGGTKGYRTLFSGELQPIYVETLRNCHRTMERLIGVKGVVPALVEPCDLRAVDAHVRVQSSLGHADVDVLIGGPPCQGFSNANRNSWSSANPNNRLVDAYVTFVEQLRPRVFVMENVQGILWTARGRTGEATGVVEVIARRLARAGYVVFPKLLDAVWYGVPQFRSRFFLVGLHRDLGYRSDDFGQWGPFPQRTHGPGLSQRYVTVRDALADLPLIGNGASAEEVAYEQPSGESNEFLDFVRRGCQRGCVVDHVTSRHADYVLERYRRIPEGGNWESIVDSMTNYSNVGRTHSNIYKRLEWDRPSVTIGHYRKSMLVHPSQHRGLSLREASRLQSFPDWFRFAGVVGGGAGGLAHKQQQLANAVCPLLAKAMGEFFLQL